MTSNATGPGSPTLTDVARAAGVSLATASRVLAGASTVDPSLAARVHEAGARLGYRPDAAAQMTAQGRSPLVGVIADQPRTARFAAIFRGVVSAAGDHGLTAMVCGASADAPSFLAAARTLAGYRPRAMILVARSDVLEDFDATWLLRSGAGTVAVADGPTSPLELPSFPVDTADGATQLVEEMRQRGYERPLVLGTGDNFPTESSRTRAIMRETQSWSTPGVLVKATAPTRDAGHDAIMTWIRSYPLPDIILAVADELAIGAMAALRDAGMTPGEQIAVTGYDDLPLAADVFPGLTTVRTGLEEAGARAVQRALSPDEDASPASPAQLTLRESTPVRQP